MQLSWQHMKDAGVAWNRDGAGACKCWQLDEEGKVLAWGVQTDAHPLFQRLSDEELQGDVAAGLLDSATEEGQKVARNSGQVRLRAMLVNSCIW